MNRAFDISKFRKEITKSIEGLGIGFNDPTDWISTGNWALNYRISGNFDWGIPLGKVTVFAGESGCLPASAKIRIKTSQNFEEQSVTVAELKQLYQTGKYDIEISGPDGYQPLGNWFDKGQLPMVKIVTQNHITTCAENHLIQLASDLWMPASELNVGDRIITESGVLPVLAVVPAEPEICYDFEVKHPNHRYWGDGISSHNSGKSYICSGNIVKNAQKKGIFVVLMDTENALDEAWLQRLGVDTSESKLLKLNLSMIDDAAKTISVFMKDYKAIPEGQDKPKVLFVIDSLGMMLTPTDVDQFDKGEMKGDMGRKPKALTSLVRNCVNMFGSHNVGLVCTNHTYASQDMFDPDDKISGGQGFIYASSIVVAMRKLKLKEDADGNKVSDVLGIRAACKVMKTRYNKPFETVQIKIPYDTGMSPHSGMTELLEDLGLLTKDGNRLMFKFTNGTEIKEFRRVFETNENDIWQTIIQDLKDHPERLNTTKVIEVENHAN
jgi:RecA/RadA recombinase